MNRNRHPDLAPGFKDAHNDPIDSFNPGDKVYFTVVAVIGEANDWAAYRGYGTPEQVARTGDKIDPETAMGLFPRLAHSGRTYRR